MPTPTSLPTTITAGATGHVSHTNTVHTAVNAITTLPTTTQTSNYTLALSDSGELVEMNSASANTLTVPPNSSVAFPVGTVVTIRQYGVGQTTITPGSGVTIRSRGAALKTAGQYAEASVTKRATDEWVCSGDVTP